MKWMMNLKVIFLLILSGIFIAEKVSAQRDTSGGLNNQVIIVKEGTISVQPAEKLPLIIELQEKTQDTVSVDYYVPQKTITVPYTPDILKALGISKSVRERQQMSFLKVGIGSLLSPFATLSYHDIVKDKFRYGLVYDFWRGQGKRENQRMNFHHGKVYASYVASKNVQIGIDGFYNRNTHHFYGYNSNIESFNKENIRQVINTGGAKIYIQNPSINSSGIQYRQDAGFTYTTLRNGVTEWNVEGLTHLSKKIKKVHSIGFMFHFDINQMKNNIPGNDSILKRNIFRTGAYYAYDDDNWQAKAGFELAFDGPITYIYPDLYLEKRLYEHHLIAYGQWKMELGKNSYASLVETNPFIKDHVSVRNSRIEKRMAGVKGTISHFDYDIQFRSMVTRRMPLFFTLASDTKRFWVEYDKVQSLGILVQASYEFQRNFKVLGAFQYDWLNAEREVKAYYQPSIQAKLGIQYDWKKKLFLGADFIGLYGAKALDEKGFVVQMPGAIDINLSAEYRFHKHFSVFCEGHNLANMKYTRWLRYPSFGAHAAVGLTFRF